MKIGELSARTGVSRRLLRYYEEQELISPDRAPNGYRDYDPRLIERVRQVRGLLDAGLPTRIIRLILPCLDVPGVLVCQDEASPEVVSALRTEQMAMSQRIDMLTRNLEAITAYLDRVEQGAELQSSR